MLSSQNANDTLVSSIDITSDYNVQLDQQLHEARICLNRLSHNLARFNDGLQTLAAVGGHFAGLSHLWKSFHISIKTNISKEVRCDKDVQHPDFNLLEFEESMLEKEPEEDEKRKDKQQQFVHNTMNETIVLDSLFFDGD
ncbi:alkylphosphocholine resistance protein lem3 [Mucor velutinosus]|uniref:Alkylphosphocholine resistance protein lem3 n=1 Tax=Mucor velutinosus TaxID=708070 RepID=A0AAN7DEM5_9FUNG|nr:alkylphosphocholine resistance protein lem3 [Mucor velutinosus]